jgi:hypothetical protein
MGPVSFVARTQRRRRRRAGIVLTLIVGLVGGLSIALFAGSSRAGSAVDRYYAPGASVDVSAYGPPLPIEQVREMPGVVEVSRNTYMGGLVTRPDGRPEVLNLLAVDGPPWDPMVRVHAGQVPAVDDLSSIAVNQRTLDDFGLHLGDEVDVRFFTVDDFKAVADGVAQATGGSARLRVTAIIDTPLDLVGDLMTGTSQIGNHTEALVPFGFYLQHLQTGDAADNGYGYDVDLADPSEIGAFEQAFTEAADSFVANSGDGGATGGTQNGLVQFAPPDVAPGHSSLAAPARVQSTVLLVLALLAGLAGAVVLTLVLVADGRLQAAEDPALEAMGMTAWQRGLLPARRSLMAVALGVGLAGAVAIALSGRFPVGTTRILERDPGISANVAVVVLGVGAVAALATIVALAVGWLGVRPRGSGRPRAGAGARGLSRVNAPVGVLVGGHLAFPGRRGRRVVPAWQSVAAGAVAVTAVLAVAEYAVTIDHLRADRAAHGFVWDLALGNPNFQLSDAAQAKLRADPALGPFVDARVGGAVIDGHPEAVVALAATGTDVTVVAGRAPRTPGEIGLGARQMKQLGVGIGDTVTFSLATTDLAQQDVPTPDLELTVVGKVLVPAFGASADLAEVATVTMDGLAAAGASPVPQLLVGNYAPGVDRASASASFEERYPLWTMTDIVPAKVHDLWSGRVLPLAGALVVALLGAVLLAYTLATTARMMRADLAVLRALGMTSRGTRDAVVWQGVVMAAVILAIGVPVGLVTGGFVWRAVASQLGVSGHVRGIVWVAAVIPAAVLVSVVAALLPARRARHLRVVEALHVE